MNNNDCIINSEYLKKFSPVPLNYNTAEISNYISIGQDIWLIPVIGQPLFDELLDEINKGEISPANQTLLLEIYPYLSYAVCLEALPFIAYHISEVGITKNKSDNSESVSPQELSYIQQTLRSQVEIRKEKLIKWLKEYGGNYPNYFPSDCDCGCSCGCGGNGKLKNPQPMTTIYRPRKINTDLK